MLYPGFVCTMFTNISDCMPLLKYCFKMYITVSFALAILVTIVQFLRITLSETNIFALKSWSWKSSFFVSLWGPGACSLKRRQLDEFPRETDPRRSCSRGSSLFPTPMKVNKNMVELYVKFVYF